MVDRAELVQVQQFGQLVGVDTITFVSVFEQSIFSRIAHHQLGHMRLQYVVQPRGPSSFFESDRYSSAQPRQELQNGRGFCFRMDSMTNLPVESNTATEMVA